MLGKTYVFLTDRNWIQTVGVINLYKVDNTHSRAKYKSKKRGPSKNLVREGDGMKCYG